MKLDKIARTILSVTALAWSIPFAQAEDTLQPGITRAQPQSAEFVKLDTNREGQRRKAVHVAAGVAGVEGVKDGLAVRK